MSARDPLEIAKALIRCRSVTPTEGGALSYLTDLLQGAGFVVHRVKFSEPGTPDVKNLFATIGKGSPHFVFGGHVDVVPPGNEPSWHYPPFAADVADEKLFGRGAADMKGAIAAFAAAALDFTGQRAPKGAISLLITGDEEGPAVNGTVKLLQWAKARGEKFDHAIVGEPTSVKRVGDTIKIGRRGSLSATLTVLGKQGHVAYPQRAENPMPAMIAMLEALTKKPLDRGTKNFEPSNLEITAVESGSTAFNVIPGEARARFNVRFNDKYTVASLKKTIARRLKSAAKGARYRLDYEPPSDPYLTKRGAFVDVVVKAIAEAGKVKAALSTSGGTSDARFIKDYCPVVDMGLVGSTMHQVNEHVPIEDLTRLTKIYRRILERYFEAFA